MYARGPSSNMCWGASVFALPSRFCFCSFVLKPPLYGTQGHYRPKTLQWQNPGSQRRICGKKRDFQLWGQRSSLDDFEEISEHNSSCPYCGIQSVDVDRSGNILRPIHQRLLVTADIPSAEIVYAAICLWIHCQSRPWMDTMCQHRHTTANKITLPLTHIQD